MIQKIVHWPVFITCMVLAGLISYGASKMFGFGFWLAFGVTVSIWLVLGLVAALEGRSSRGSQKNHSSDAD